jgi:hypothetical protein
MELNKGIQRETQLTLEISTPDVFSFSFHFAS